MDLKYQDSLEFTGLYEFSLDYGFGVEKAATCRETCVQVPVCGILPGVDGGMHKEMAA